MHKISLLTTTFVLLLLTMGSVCAANATKTGAGTDLTGATAGVWSGGSGANGSPGSGDIALWNSASLGAGLTLGTSKSWGGISVSGALSDIAITGAGTLTNGASGIDMSASTVNMAITNNLTLGASQTWNVNSAKTLTALGIISGTGMGLTKSGAGTLTLNNANTYSGATTVNGGTLVLSGSGALATNSAITINGGTLDMGSQNATNFLGSNTGITFGANGGNLNGTGTNNLIGLTGGYTAFTVPANAAAVVNENVNITNVAGVNYDQIASVGSGGTLTINGKIIALNSGSELWLSGGGTLVANNPGNIISALGWNAGTVTTTNFGTLGSYPFFGVMGQNTGSGPCTFNYAGPAVSTAKQLDGNAAVINIYNNGTGLLTFTGSPFNLRYGGAQTGSGQQLVFGGPSDIAIAGVIQDNTSGTYVTGVVKTNNNTLTLYGNNTNSGPTTVWAGTLQLGDGATKNGLVTGNITNYSTLVFNNPNPQTFGAAVSGSGVVIKRAAGTLTLTGANTYSGPTFINSGTLALSGSGSISNSALLSVTNGAILDASGLASGLNLAPGQTLFNSAASTGTLSGNLNTAAGTVSVSYSAGQSAFLVTNGTLTLAAATTITVNNTGTALTNGAYKIISKASGGQVGGAVPGVVVTGGGIVGGSTALLQVTNGELFVAVGSNSVVVNLTWTGADAANPTRWNNLQTDTNWFTAQSVADRTHYDDGDQVLFNDANNRQYTVNVATLVSPGWVTVNNSGGNYIFNSSGGGIAGATGLEKDGSGNLTLNLANSFSGATTINGGSVILGNGNALAASLVTVNSDGGLKFSVNAATLGGLAGSGGLALTFNGSSPVTLSVGTNNLNATYDGSLSGPGSLVKQGTGNLALTGTSVLGGATTVAKGGLTVNGALATSALLASGGVLSGAGAINGPVTVQAGGALSPGISGSGQLAINSSLTLAVGSVSAFQLGRNFTNYNNRVAVLNQITYGGTLVVTNPNNISLTAGDVFQLFQASAYSGTFSSSNLPALSNGVKWDLGQLTNNGTIRVVPPWSVPGVFANHMVLQRDMAVPVWGTAEPGQTITVTFGGQTKLATAAPDRSWGVYLDSMPVNTNGQQLSISIAGVTNLSFTNVVVGDVWLASGQSNMYFPVNGNNPNQSVSNAAAETAAANYPLIRHMRVRQTGSLNPAWDATLDWSWTPCSPASVSNLSAAAYFFARTLFQSNSVQGMVVPIGILESSYGGTPMEAWSSVAAMNAIPELQAFATQSLANYFQGLQTSPTFVPGAMFNAMISPLVPFGLRGVIWYQGESLGGSGTMMYRVLFPTMIQDWRSRWQQPNLPFYFVQLPSLVGTDNLWPYTREAQTLTLRTATNTGMAVIFDVDDPNAIHPGNKVDVGTRLAMLSLNHDYGFTNVVPSGPLFRSYAIETNQIRIAFDFVAGGLMTGQKNNLDPVQELPGVSPQWFEIAESNQLYVSATAQIDPNGTVVVSSPSVPNPVFVRYAWKGVPMGTNLYNRAGLPASPFRIPVWTNSLPVSGIQINAGSVQSACAVPNNVTWWVEYNDALGGSAWSPLALPQTGTGAVQTVADSISGHSQRFYRWVEMP